MKINLERSPLYCLRSRKRLAGLLGLNLNELEKLARNEARNYNLFPKKTASGKIRDIEWPKESLLRVSRTLNRLLLEIATPEYLHSVKDRSYISNALSHKMNVPIVKIDIRKFYPSASYIYVYRCFTRVFRCSPDVASIFCKISTFNGHLPTGSPSSGSVSFWAYKSMFDEIYELSRVNDLVMSVCVDDITFSGLKANSLFLFKVRSIIRRYMLDAHKRRQFKADEDKIVTGVVLTSDGPRLPHKRRNLIFENLKSFLAEEEAAKKLVLAKKILGRLAEAEQIEPSTYGSVRKLLKFKLNSP